MIVSITIDGHVLIINRNDFSVLCTGCPRKNAPLFWGAVAPINFELGLKVGGILESSGSQL